MKKLLVASLLSAQILGSAAPAMAQSFSATRDVEAGTFGGFRLRIPFGGAHREPVRAGLAIAPALRTDYSDGRGRTRIGEGLEFGYRSGQQVSFSIAGRDLNRRSLGFQDGNGERRGGVPTWVLIAGGVLIVTVAGALVFYDALDDASE